MKKTGNILFVLKVLVFTYVISFLLLLIFAAIVFKMECGDNVISWGIAVIYFLSAFFGGMIAGKMKKSRRLIWGLIIGTAYVAVLVIVSLIMGNVVDGQTNIAIALGISIIGGILGGMFS